MLNESCQCSRLDLARKGFDVPFKGMLILTEKQDDLYQIISSPRENFDSKPKEFVQICPTGSVAKIIKIKSRVAD